ncbi:hypothetical protein DFQ26_005799 [Actinomortierella ambigua]|nr:hypothetical protein DFQ26_005799 [Actinomortierella ambigua]
MARFLSKPVTLIVFAVLQVCTALKPQTGRLYRISLGGLHLQPEGIDRPVHFVPDQHQEQSTIWEVFQVDEHRVTIRHPQLNGYLSYIEAHPTAILMLASKPRHWILNKVDDKGRYEMMATVLYESKPLVVQTHPLQVNPPLAGLGFRPKDECSCSHILEFEQVDVVEHGRRGEPPQSRLAIPSSVAVEDGTYVLRSGGRYLTATDHPTSPPHLSHLPSADSEWIITNVQSCCCCCDDEQQQNGDCERGVTIRSGSTGLYLGFHYRMRGAMLHMQREPKVWTLHEIRRAVFAIRTATASAAPVAPAVAADGGSRGQEALDVALLPRVGRHVAGLALPSKDESHEWEILAW